jgi:tetratricopeptide (TPR) repeat protein
MATPQAAAPVNPRESAPASPESQAAPPPAAARGKPVPMVHAPAKSEPMPEIAADSPARMLDPPISVRRSQIDLEGVGNAVSVRTVSQSAQDTVVLAYNALVRGDYDTALGLYGQVLKQEPNSMLAQLGRGAAFQKLGNAQGAHAAYDAALKLDPDNREALTNVIALEAERQPGDALVRLIDLEKEHPNFSPIKAEIGLVYAHMGNLEGALDYFQRALAITPDSPLYLYNLALVLDRLGHADQAAHAYDRVLDALSVQSVPGLSIADIRLRADYLRTK